VGYDHPPLFKCLVNGQASDGMNTLLSGVKVGDLPHAECEGVSSVVVSEARKCVKDSVQE
jgi:hypothetical protein